METFQNEYKGKKKKKTSAIRILTFQTLIKCNLNKEKKIQISL